MVNTNTSNKKIVAIGGGHGLGRILSSLSDYGSQVTGIVATTDNGGSTGRIRACQGGIAWGDTRNCINQLITEPSVGSMIFEYRFRGNGELNGHNLGNLMLTALDNLSVRPLDAINLIRDMLKVSTHIIPMSEYPADLAAMTPSGEIICGETSVDELIEVPQRIKRMVQPDRWILSLCCTGVNVQLEAEESILFFQINITMSWNLAIISMSPILPPATMCGDMIVIN